MTSRQNEIESHPVYRGIVAFFAAIFAVLNMVIIFVGSIASAVLGIAMFLICAALAIIGLVFFAAVILPYEKFQNWNYERKYRVGQTRHLP